MRYAQWYGMCTLTRYAMCALSGTACVHAQLQILSADDQQLLLNAFICCKTMALYTGWCP